MNGTPELPSPRRRRFVAPLAAALAGMISYAPQLSYPFVYDDLSIIVNNPAVSGGPWSETLTRPYWPENLSIDPLYRPVTTLSLRINYALFGDRPAGYRVTNALLHSLCCALVALFAAGLWRNDLAAWAAGLLFAVHPVHAEAVCLVVGRAELLAALFCLWVLLRHLHHRTLHRPAVVRYHVGTSLLFLAALGCKEHAVFILPAVIVLDLLFRPAEPVPEGEAPYRAVLIRSHYAGLIACLIVFFLVRWVMFGARATLPAELVDPFANPLAGASLLTQLTTPPALLLLAVELLVWPMRLCPIWAVGGFGLPDSFARLDVIAGMLLTILVVAIAIRGTLRRRRWSLPITLAALFLIVPCHFLPAANWLFAERWLYLPSAWVMIGLAGLAGRRPIAVAAFAGAVVLFAINWQYQQNWRSTPHLMQAVIDRQPGNYHGLIGHLKATSEETGYVASAAEEVNRLHRDFPDSHQTWYFRALYAWETNQPAEVLHAVEQYLLIAPPDGMPPDLVDAARWAQQSLPSDEGQ